MGLVQLGKLSGFLERRRHNAAAWRRDLEPFAEVLQLQEATPRGQHAWFGIPLTVRQQAPFSLAELRQHLDRAGIETRPIICGNIAAQPGLKLFEHRAVGTLEHATAVMQRGFSFGNHQAIDAAARDFVSVAIADFMAVHGIGRGDGP
jgi:CDP-6-deoxy-D-xylo-4-hexulose-3-dehydrase